MNNPLIGGPQTSGIGVPTSPYALDRARRQQSQLQPSPALPPQPSNGSGAIPSPIMTPQRSTSPESSPSLVSHWKQPMTESTTPNDWSSSLKGTQDHIERSSDTGNSGNNENITINNVINSNTGHSNGTQMAWADQTQNETPNWGSKPDLNDSSQPLENGDIPNIFVGNLALPVTEEELKEYFEAVDCQVEKVRLMHDRVSQVQLSHAYVDFQDEASIEKAVSLNGKPYGLTNNPLKINRYQYHERSFRGRGRNRGRGRYMNHRGRGGHGNNSHNNGNQIQNG
ncbi:524_t:CDS:2, partial [Scutellospora calospora]